MIEEKKTENILRWFRVWICEEGLKASMRDVYYMISNPTNRRGRPRPEKVVAAGLSVNNIAETSVFN